MANILILDDDRGIREELAVYLMKEGHDVTVDSGVHVFDILGDKAYDLIITDVMMPNIKGTEVLSYVLREHPLTRVIIITAYGSVDEAVAAMKNGASDYILKPFRVDAVRVAVEKTLKEASFKELMKGEFKIDGDVLEALTSISHPLRREIIGLLKQGRQSLSDMANKMNVKDPPKLSFHLNKLKDKGLITQSPDRKYLLTPFGTKVLKTLYEIQTTV